MLNYNSPISDTKKYSEIEISEIEPIFKLNLRGKNRDFTTKVGKSLSIIPPTDPNTSSGNENLNILWLSPDEWMLYSNNKINLILLKKTNTPSCKPIIKTIKVITKHASFLGFAG